MPVRGTGMENPLKLKRIHHVEFWVGNARQAAYFYRKGFGFSQVAYSGLETGQRQRASYAIDVYKRQAQHALLRAGVDGCALSSEQEQDARGGHLL